MRVRVSGDLPLYVSKVFHQHKSICCWTTLASPPAWRSKTMLNIGTSYRFSLPWYVTLALVVVGLMALVIFAFFAAALIDWDILPHLKCYSSQGDFFGGHIAAVVGCITLLVVVLTGFLQISYERRFRLREHFLSGIGVIGQYDISNPGCEQALRLLDYYSTIALELDDVELLLLLNTVMTKEIRKVLEILDAGNQDTYLNARAARKKVQQVLKEHNLARKGRKPSKDSD